MLLSAAEVGRRIASTHTLGILGAAVPPAICGGGTAPSVACPPAMQPYTQNLLAKSVPESSLDGASNSGVRGLAQSPSGIYTQQSG